MRTALFVSLFALIAACAMGSETARIDPIDGVETTATLTVPGRELDVDGALFLPIGVRKVHDVIVLIRRGVSKRVYEDPAWRKLARDLNCGFLHATIRVAASPSGDAPTAEQALRDAAVGGGEGLLLLLERLGVETSHPELKDAKVVLWGHSAAGSFALTFAALYPQRTIAIVRYHSHRRGMDFDLAAVSSVPALIFAGAKDETAGVEDSQALWEDGRNAGAPWTLAIEPDAAHGSPEALLKANELAIPWVAAVFKQRMGAPGGSPNLASPSIGWLADPQSGEISKAAEYMGDATPANWLPDEASALGWRAVSGF